MVAIHEGHRERQVLQPIQGFIIAAVTKPHVAKVSGDDDHIVLRYPSLLRKVFRLETQEVSVGISGHIDHANFLLLG